jgi:hypothetical protein
MSFNPDNERAQNMFLTGPPTLIPPSVGNNFSRDTFKTKTSRPRKRRKGATERIKQRSVSAQPSKHLIMVSVCNYEFKGQIYSPAFSEPESPPASPESSHISVAPIRQERDASDHLLSSYSNKQPKFPTKYHEMLQPLNPITTLRVKAILPTHKSTVNAKLQEQFLRVLQLGNTVADVEAFLRDHSENIDINQYNSDGQTPLHLASLEGNCDAVELLIRFGADIFLTTRDGFSVMHLAAFSGNSKLLCFFTSLIREK